MKITLTDKDQSLLNQLSANYLDQNNLKEYLDFFSKTSRNLLQSEYSAIMLFNSRFLENVHSVDNNPPEFTKAYFEKYIQQDKPLHDLIHNPRKIYTHSREYQEDKDMDSLKNEINKIRPGGDCFYDPILYRNEILGFMGYVKPPGKDKIFAKKDFFLQTLMKNSLFSGIHHFAYKEKIELLEDFRSHGDFAYFYCWLNGEIDIPGRNNHQLIEDVFELDSRNNKKLFNHTLIKQGIFMKKSSKDEVPFVRKININNKIYIIKMFCKEKKEHIPLLFMVTIEKEKNNFRYSFFGEKYNLTARELDVIQCIMQGFGNNEISKALTISESTVKKHISNIFEKTCFSTRTQIVLALANS